MHTGKIISGTSPDARLLALTLGLVIATNLACDLYASFHARGLYADAAALLAVIYERNWFLLDISGYRAAVEALRQMPIVLLLKYTTATLFQCGQVFTFVMLAFPTILMALCWPVAPRDAKGWMLFPLASLLIGFAPTSMHAVGEAAIATYYFWVLLFLLLFRVGSVKQQAFFLLLCIPAFWLHEGSFPLTLVLLLAVVLRVHAAAGVPHERLFASLASLLLALLLIHQIRGVVFPQYPGDREHIMQGLTHFEFLYADHRFNLPLVSGSLALLTLFAVSYVYASMQTDKAARVVKMISAAWVLFALAAIAVAITVETSFSPAAQAQARYHPVFVSAGLGTIMILLRRFQLPERIWKNTATILILITLCAAQAVTDVEATRQWNTYIADLQSSLAQERGLIAWETRLSTAHARAEVDWRIFEVRWTIPYICIIFATNGVINAMIDLPKDLTFRPLDPELPDRLPKLSGIDYGPYKRFLAAQRAIGSP